MVFEFDTETTTSSGACKGCGKPIDHDIDETSLCTACLGFETEEVDIGDDEENLEDFLKRHKDEVQNTLYE